MRFRILLVVLGAIGGAVSLVSFAEPAVEAKQLQPRVLIVFKNGLSWIEHRGEVALSDGWGSIPTTPDAALGTVSLTSDKAKVDEVRTAGGMRTTTRGSSLDSILAGSAGRMVTLRAGDRDISGRLLPAEERSPAEAELYTRNGWAEAPGVVLVQSGGKTTAVSRSLITAVTLDGDAPAPEDRPAPSLRFHVAESAASAPVRLSYVRSGIGWFPDYSITLDGDGRAAVIMRATLVDDGEALRDTDVFFAVGVPNFVFGHVPSPLSASQSLAALFQALGMGAQQVFSMMENSINVALHNTGRNPGAAVGATPAEGTEGESTEDFFLYSRKRVTLAKGERAAFPILEAAVKYSDLYTLDIPRTPQGETADRVWHSIRLENPTQLPWATAPALVIADGRPIAQEILRYTPARGATTLRLTVANNVVADRSEFEISRQRDTVQRFGNVWDAVTVEGTIDIRNFKDEPVVVAISREVEGEAIRASGQRVTRVATEPRAMNPIERLEWEIPLKSGEKKTIKYQYKVFVRE